MAISRELIAAIRNSYRLDWDGIHGVAHWARVRDIGLKLSKVTGAKPEIVELFAFLHDSQRFDDGYDERHGKRAVNFARSLRGRVIHIPDYDFELLAYACEEHTHGKTDGDITVQTCWDADRLDLGRVGIVPSPQKLCTSAAKKPEMLDWAFRRSVMGYKIKTIHDPDYRSLWD